MNIVSVQNPYVNKTSKSELCVQLCSDQVLLTFIVFCFSEILSHCFFWTTLVCSLCIPVDLCVLLEQLYCTKMNMLSMI